MSIPADHHRKRALDFATIAAPNLCVPLMQACTWQRRLTPCSAQTSGYAAWRDFANSCSVYGAMSTPFGRVTVPPSRKNLCK